MTEPTPVYVQLLHSGEFALFTQAYAHSSLKPPARTFVLASPGHV